MELIALMLALLTFVLVLLRPRTASAHCDTEDGPAVQDGRMALKTGNVNYALKWIGANGEPELRAVFDQAMSARAAGEAVEDADERFLNAMIRIHRAGEGEGFDGIKPSGYAVDPIVLAADKALADGHLKPLKALLPAEKWPGLERRFNAALARKDFDVDDVAAGRDYIHAYVSYFKFAEGEEHDHHHGAHSHAHHHG